MVDVRVCVHDIGRIFSGQASETSWVVLPLFVGG